MASPIEYNADNVPDHLGTGSSGTYVFRGKYTWRVTGKVEDVAIKQILKIPGSDFPKQLLREITTLQSLSHKNIIQYIDAEERGPFVLIALQLCLGSLVNVLDIKKDVFGKKFSRYKTHLWSTKKTLLIGVAHGLEYIHKNNIVHRDLKPQNILVTVDESNAGLLKAVISDFGLCREVDTSKFNPSCSLIGSLGWMPKEILMRKKNLPTPAGYLDIFAFGCIVHFVMSFKRSSSHPFGKDDARNQNIRIPNRVTYLYENLVGNSFTAQIHPYYGDTILADMLIDVCVSSDPKIRPRADAILIHPFFWSYAKRKQYVCEHFNSFKDYSKSKSPTPAPITKLQSLWESLCSGKEFHDDIPEVWEYVDMYNKSLKRATPDHWKSNIFDGLMRTIRNLSEHWTSAVSLHPSIENLFGNSDLEGNCNHENMGIYFFEKIHQSFPIIYVSFMSQDAHESSDPSNQKKRDKLAVQTLERVLKPAE